MRVDVPVLFVELKLQLAELHLILPKQRSLIDIFVYPGFILDLLGPGCELQSGDALSKTLRGRTDHGHHGSFAVATKRVLKQARQFAISVRDVRARSLVGECSDDISQAGEGLINLLGLF
jgi:hypothetical protein